MECDLKFSCYELFKILKITIIFKMFLCIKKTLFYDFFICFITSWLEIGNGKKCYFQYNLNIHILSQFSTTLEKVFNLLKFSHPNVLSLIIPKVDKLVQHQKQQTVEEC
jgi:hypothetical protein